MALDIFPISESFTSEVGSSNPLIKPLGILDILIIAALIVVAAVVIYFLWPLIVAIVIIGVAYFIYKWYIKRK